MSTPVKAVTSELQPKALFSPGVNKRQRESPVTPPAMSLSVAELRKILKEELATQSEDLTEKISAKVGALEAQMNKKFESQQALIDQLMAKQRSYQDQMGELKQDKENADNRARRNNLVFAGIPEDPNGRENCIDKIRGLCIQVLG